MSFLSRKQELNLEDFLRDFYDTQIINPVIGKIDAGSEFSDLVKKNIAEVFPEFSKIDSKKITEEIKVLRFELFALAWTHKFVSGKLLVKQSDFTKRYLYEKGKGEIWESMESYNNMIDSVTLNWLASLGKANLGFNYNMREDLAKKNIEAAEELEIESDERVARVNHRIWSDSAWKQKLMLEPLVVTFYNRLNMKNLTEEAIFPMAATIKGLYDGAEQSWSKVKFKV